MDHHNIPGFDKVDKLAHALVAIGLRNQESIHSMEAGRIMELWRRLDTRDRARTVPEPQFRQRGDGDSEGDEVEHRQATSPSSRFRQTNAPAMPGVQLAR